MSQRTGSMPPSKKTWAVAMNMKEDMITLTFRPSASADRVPGIGRSRTQPRLPGTRRGRAEFRQGGNIRGVRVGKTALTRLSHGLPRT